MSEYLGVPIVLMIKDCCPVGTELLGNTLNFVAASPGLRLCKEKLNWLLTIGSPLRVTKPVIKEKSGIVNCDQNSNMLRRESKEHR